MCYETKSAVTSSFLPKTVKIPHVIEKVVEKFELKKNDRLPMTQIEDDNVPVVVVQKQQNNV